jgi:hypothetical protein
MNADGISHLMRRIAPSAERAVELDDYVAGPIDLRHSSRGTERRRPLAPLEAEVRAGDLQPEREAADGAVRTLPPAPRDRFGRDPAVERLARLRG